MSPIENNYILISILSSMNQLLGDESVDGVYRIESNGEKVKNGEN